ncbi:MAG: cyclic nucleotide-binding domain-containing protein [Candidatus Electryonea clarkiae]|nr:cyclic nucleotide-binding domain-containing protein [Candidatus Electryonea clarkiae]MDP8285321.1 cyclic nucleotide-binding domain-containing protein [Candidatus Electryonea clarkiae]
MTLNKGDFFGEMSLFEDEYRSADVRALCKTRVLTIDKTSLLGRIKEDPTMAFHMIQKISGRLRHINTQHGRIRSTDRRNWDKRQDKLEENN